MISTIKIKVNAAHPNMPLHPFVAYKGSLSTVMIADVPKQIGKWKLNKVYVNAIYPDNSVNSTECVKSGEMFVGTVDGSTLVGKVTNGYTITASGMTETNEPITNVVLGKGDVIILSDQTTTEAGVNTHFLNLCETIPDNPKFADAYVHDNQISVYDGDKWNLLSSSFAYESTKSISATNALTAQHALTSDNSTYALTSQYALTANNANNANNALTAENANYATNALTANYALTAENATNALTADQALTAGIALTAETAYTSLTANYATDVNSDATGLTAYAKKSEIIPNSLTENLTVNLNKKSLTINDGYKTDSNITLKDGFVAIGGEYNSLEINNKSTLYIGGAGTGNTGELSLTKNGSMTTSNGSKIKFYNGEQLSVGDMSLPNYIKSVMSADIGNLETIIEGL